MLWAPVALVLLVCSALVAAGPAPGHVADEERIRVLANVDSHHDSDETAAGGLPLPERFWAEVLSKEPERIRAALGSLSKQEADSVKDHLRRMATEDGWHPAQRVSARAALDHFETPSETETG